MGTVHGQPIERVDRRFDADLQPVAQPGGGIRRQAENRRQIAVEIREPRSTAVTGQRQRARGREHRYSGAAFRRPTTHEHDPSPRGDPHRKRVIAGIATGHAGEGAGEVRSRYDLAPDASRVDRLLRYGVMQAAFFDLDKTMIATSSVMALGGPLLSRGPHLEAHDRARHLRADRLHARRRGRREDGAHARGDARAHEGLGPRARRARSCARRSTRCSRPSSTPRRSSSSRSTSARGARR